MKHFKGNKKPYIIRLLAAAAFFAAALIAFLPQDILQNTSVSKFFASLMQFNFAPALGRVVIDFSIIAFLIVIFHLAFAFLFGRYYCSVFCPFGILQDIIGTIWGTISKRKTGCQKNLYILRYLIAFFVLCFLFAGVSAVFRFFDPYSNFGNIISAAYDFKTPHISAYVAFFVIVALVIFKNRLFCTSICPAGTILGLFAKISPYKLEISKDICKGCGVCEKQCPTGAINSKEKSLDNERCIRCNRCIASCPGGGIKLVRGKKNKPDFDENRREFIKTSAKTGFIIAAGTLALGSGALIFAKGKDAVKNIANTFKIRPILPPGAKSPEDFIKNCTNCGLCVQNCKGKILKKPNSDFKTVHVDFSEGKCEYDCKNCSDVCPFGAIKKMSLEEKQNTRIALAKFDPEKCVKCTLCAHICPKGAIEINPDKTPKYIAQKCIGCGACANACISHAIEMVSINAQTLI